MHNRSHMLLAALIAALIALSLAATSASASRGLELSVAEGSLGRVRHDYTALTFSEPGAAFRVICEFTRTVSLHRSIGKSAGTLVGLVNEIAVRNCRGGTIILLTATLPWHIRYVSFTGTLPNITSLRLQTTDVAILFQAFFSIARCLYRGSPQYTTTGNPITEARLDSTIVVPLADESLSAIACPRSLTLAGTGRYSPAIRVRLV